MRTLDEIVAAIPTDVLELCRRLRAAGKRGWVVGGCVRDMLRGEPAKDWDLATDALPEEVTRIFPKVIPTGIEHGTVTVLLNRVPYEVTTLRGEGAYDDGRRPNEVRFLDDIEQDLARRDFTFNAIAIEPLQAALIDPFGGRDDLTRGVLRAVGDARERFTEDGLRVLRACRFAATLGCSVHPDTLVAMASDSAHTTFRRVSAERIHDEWLKALRATRTPSVAFELMQQTGVMQLISPELAATAGCGQDDSHAYDVWRHSLAVLDALPRDPILRLAGLLHDIGKPPTRQLQGDEMRFEGHAEIGAELVEQLLRRLKFSNDHRKRCGHLVRHHQHQPAEPPCDADTRRWIRRVSREALDDVLLLARADWDGKGTPQPAMAAQLAALDEQAQRLLREGFPLSTRELALNGRALMQELGMAPGRQVGELLAQLLERVTDEPQLNRRERLLQVARALLAERSAEAP